MYEDPGSALAEWVRSSGPEALDDPRRVRSVLRDAAPQSTLEVSLLVAAVEDGVPARLSGASQGLLGGDVERLTDELAARRGLSRTNAAWAVQTLTWVLGRSARPAPLTAVAGSGGGAWAPPGGGVPGGGGWSQPGGGWSQPGQAPGQAPGQPGQPGGWPQPGPTTPGWPQPRQPTEGWSQPGAGMPQPGQPGPGWPGGPGMPPGGPGGPVVPGGGGNGKNNQRTIIIAVAAGVVVLLAAGLVLYFTVFTKSDPPVAKEPTPPPITSSSPPSGTGSGTTGSRTTGGGTSGVQVFPNAAEKALMSHLPNEYRDGSDNCVRFSASSDNVIFNRTPLAAISCTPYGGTPAPPDGVVFVQYGSDADAQAVFDDVLPASVSHNGDCVSSAPVVNDYQQGGSTVGSDACFTTSDGAAYISWTRNQDAIYAEANRSDGDLSSLKDWFFSDRASLSN